MAINQQALMLGAAGVASLAIVGWLVTTIRTKPPAPPAVTIQAAPPAPAAKPDAGAIASLNLNDAPAKPAAPVPPAGTPKFDVVRVEPTGEAVIAGTALPGSTVRLQSGGRVLAETKVPQSGQFVLIPPPLPPGDHILSLETTPEKGAPLLSRQSVAVAVPKEKNGEVIVALSEPDRATVLLSDTIAAALAKPATPAPAPLGPVLQQGQAAPMPAGARVAIRTVEVEESGAFFATGRAPPGAFVRLYLNDAFVANVVTGADGRWTLKIEKGMQPGIYAVRTDEVDPASGAVVSRAEVPFTYPPRVAAQVPPLAPAASAPPPAQRTASAQIGVGANVPAKPGIAVPLPPAVPAPSVTASAPVVVGPLPAVPPVAVAGAPAPLAATPQPAPAPPQATVTTADAVVQELATAKVGQGDSLWRISRIVYGRGIRYTQIYKANADQIRNPKLIFPGQILVVPKVGVN